MNTNNDKMMNIFVKNEKKLFSFITINITTFFNVLQTYKNFFVIMTSLIALTSCETGREKDIEIPKKNLEEIILPLKESCRWWLIHHPGHPNLSETQKKNWLLFCKGVTSSNSSDDIQQLIKTYLTHYNGPPPIFQTEETNVFCTGYFEPTLKGSYSPSKKYSIPLYKLPTKKHFTRKEIQKGALCNKNLELIWVDDAVKAFFLEIQGSGRIVLEDGSIIRVGYAGQNGYPYTPIGRVMFEKGYITENEINLKGIQKFLYEHPSKINEILNTNQSYVFFKIRKDLKNSNQGPIGSQGLPLTPYHSVAADVSYWPLGMLLLVKLDHNNLHKLVLTQDAGGEIKGPLRFDLFCGWDENAKRTAGYLQSNGTLVSFWPKG